MPPRSATGTQGIGSDGLILAGESAHADVRMTMFNADGSEGQMCGNGVRCLVSFAVEQGIVPRERSPVVVETASGDKVVTPVWENGVMVRARVDMGAPNVATEDVPVDAPGFAMLMDFPLEIDGETIPISCVSMGNPHAVAFIRTPVADYPLHEIGPKVEHHPMFPERVNFEIVNVIDQGSRQGKGVGAGARVSRRRAVPAPALSSPSVGFSARPGGTSRCRCLGATSTSTGRARVA